MTSATGRWERGRSQARGLTIAEVLIALAIVSLFLIPTAMVYRRYRQGLLLSSAVGKVVSACELARACAVAERREFAVVVESGRLAVFRDGTERVGKVYHLPDVVVVSATRGFSPAVFLPDGTAKEAGNIVLRDTVTGGQKTIVLHNMTRVCVVQ